MKDFMNRLQDFLNRSLPDGRIKILEAGCGSISKIKFPEKAHITGIDISRKQLERNQLVHEKIQGDLQTYSFPPGTFDLIVCWDVLEHLPQPREALNKMTDALKKGGLLLLKVPNLMSVKGLITKYSPYKIHQLYYKLVYKVKEPGKDDVGPFKTHLKSDVAPNSLKRFAYQKGLYVPFSELYDISEISYTFARLKSRKLMLALYKSVKSFFEVITFKKITDSEAIVVIQKPLQQ
jgi:SAM-dependent methyltransferase